jgi:hypothetical protein
MKRLLGLVFVFAMFVGIGNLDAAEGEKTPGYIGSLTCAKVCHKKAKQGEQRRIWEESAHAKAFETLASPAALEIGKAKGISNPQEADECLVCHVTAHGISDDLKGKKFSHTEGVGCEVCHGPGSIYKKRSIMKVREESVAAGLILPDEQTCLKCHNEKSPTYKPFDYVEKWGAIAHPKPAKGE